MHCLRGAAAAVQHDDDGVMPPGKFGWCCHLGISNAIQLPKPASWRALQKQLACCMQQLLWSRDVVLAACLPTSGIVKHCKSSAWIYPTVPGHCTAAAAVHRRAAGAGARRDLPSPAAAVGSGSAARARCHLRQGGGWLQAAARPAPAARSYHDGPARGAAGCEVSTCQLALAPLCWHHTNAVCSHAVPSLYPARAADVHVHCMFG